MHFWVLTIIIIILSLNILVDASVGISEPRKSSKVFKNKIKNNWSVDCIDLVVWQYHRILWAVPLCGVDLVLLDLRLIGKEG